MRTFTPLGFSVVCDSHPGETKYTKMLRSAKEQECGGMPQKHHGSVYVKQVEKTRLSDKVEKKSDRVGRKT